MEIQTDSEEAFEKIFWESGKVFRKLGGNHKFLSKDAKKWFEENTEVIQ